MLCNLEVLLSRRPELIDAMIESGILSVLGDVVINETDALVLVCFLHFYL